MFAMRMALPVHKKQCQKSAYFYFIYVALVHCLANIGYNEISLWNITNSEATPKISFNQSLGLQFSTQFYRIAQKSIERLEYGLM